MGVTKRKQGGHNYLGAESRWGHQITAGAPKSTNNVTSAFFNAVLLLAKDFRLQHGGAKLASCPWRRLTSLRPWGHGLFGLMLVAPLSAVCLYSYADYKITNFGLRASTIETPDRDVHLTV